MILSFDIGIKNLSYCVMYKDETYDSINKNKATKTSSSKIEDAFPVCVSVINDS